MLLCQLKLFWNAERQRHKDVDSEIAPDCWFTAQMLVVDQGWAQVKSQKFSPDLPHRWTELCYSSLPPCLLGSALAGNWSQRPELKLECKPRLCKIECGCFKHETKWLRVLLNQCSV